MEELCVIVLELTASFADPAVQVTTRITGQIAENGLPGVCKSTKQHEGPGAVIRISLLCAPS